MAAKHKSHGKHGTIANGTESRERSTGRDYPDDRFTGGGPWNQGVEHYLGNRDDKTLYSPTNTADGDDLPIRYKEYDGLWEGK